jgi:hypothetical protein
MTVQHDYPDGIERDPIAAAVASRMEESVDKVAVDLSTDSIFSYDIVKLI